MLSNVLMHIMHTGIIASFSWGDCGMHVGKVLGWNEDEILIAHISAGGYYDGYVLRPLDGLFHVTYGGKYEHKIEKLYIEKEQHHGLHGVSGETLWNSALEYALQEKLIVTAESGSSSVTGHIEEWDDTALKLCVLDQFGTNDGSAIIFRNEIDLLAIDTDYEQDLRLL